MRIFLDFRCVACLRAQEYFVESGTKEVPCGHCGARAKKLIPAVRSKLDPTSDFPGAAMKWEKVREQKMAQEKKASEG